jgi:hypothetical protein
MSTENYNLSHSSDRVLKENQSVMIIYCLENKNKMGHATSLLSDYEQFSNLGRQATVSILQF